MKNIETANTIKTHRARMGSSRCLMIALS